MNTAPTGFFSEKINETDASSKLPFMPANFLGRVRVDACKGITRRGGNERAFIVEMTILTSNLAHLDPSDENYVGVGSRHSYFQSLKEEGTAWPACIAFLYACLGVVPGRDQAVIDRDIKPKQNTYLNASMTPENPLAGSEVMLQTTAIKTKRVIRLPDGTTEQGTFTLHNFSPAPAEEQTAAA